MGRTISEVMSQRALVELPPTGSVHEAAELMCRHAVGSVLVTGQGRLEGIFTERDVVCRVVAQGRDPETTRLGEVMTGEPDTIAPENLALDALHKMRDGAYRHLPVVDRGRLVGVVSRRDFDGLEKARLDEETTLWEQL